MNFTLLQAAAQRDGWSQLIFFIPLMIFLAITIFIVIKGNSKPLIPTIYFLGISTLLFITLLSEIDTFSNFEKAGVISFIIIFLLPGAYYLYKTIDQNSNKSKITSSANFSENNLQTDIYTQITNLNELKEKGIITEDEFQDKKKKLLAKI